MFECVLFDTQYCISCFLSLGDWLLVIFIYHSLLCNFYYDTGVTFKSVGL